MAALTIVAVTFMTGNTVFADSVTSVVMRYEDKVFTKEIYGTEVEEIKNGAFTDGLRDISGLIDSLEYQMNGDVRINRNAVTDAVKSLIIAGQTSINIDLSRYKAGAGASTGTLPESNIAATASENNSQMVATGVTDPVVSPALDSLEIDTKLSEASTKFRANEDRAKNIRNAASKINGMVIMPGQLFSATTAFGPRTVANGYGLGNVISGDTYVKGVGGGICQVSSTLNLAMLRAGVLPMERHNHSHRSSYIGSGLDATISGSSLDYKFVNPYQYPLYISAVTNGGVITISVYSNHDATGGVVYEPVVSGGKMSNTTHVIGKLAGVQVSDRVAYSSRYRQ